MASRPPAPARRLPEASPATTATSTTRRSGERPSRASASRRGRSSTTGAPVQARPSERWRRDLGGTSSPHTRMRSTSHFPSRSALVGEVPRLCGELRGADASWPLERGVEATCSTQVGVGADLAELQHLQAFPPLPPMGRRALQPPHRTQPGSCFTASSDLPSAMSRSVTGPSSSTHDPGGTRPPDGPAVASRRHSRGRRRTAHGERLTSTGPTEWIPP